MLFMFLPLCHPSFVCWGVCNCKAVYYGTYGAFLVAQTVKNLPAIWDL